MLNQLSHIQKSSPSPMLSQESLKVLYSIWRKGGYMGLVVDKIMEIIQGGILMIIFSIILLLDYKNIFNKENINNELNEYFNYNEDRLFYCQIVVILFFPFLIYKSITIIFQLTNYHTKQAHYFFNYYHFEEFNRNWNGIASIVSLSNQQINNERTFIVDTTSFISSCNSEMVRNVITFKENLLTSVLRNYDYLKKYHTKYTLSRIESILFPPFVDENFIQNLPTNPILQNKWKEHIQQKTKLIKMIHIFPLNLLYVLLNGYHILLKYFSSFTSKNLILLNKCRYTKYAKLLYRLPNELQHETNSRLLESIPIAKQLTGINRNTSIYHIMRLFRIILSGICLIIIPLASLTKFRIFGISSTVLLFLAVPTLALLFSQTMRKQTIKSPQRLASYLERFTKYPDKRWNDPRNERRLLNEFEECIFKSNLFHCIDEIMAPLKITQLLKTELFSEHSTFVDLVSSGTIQLLPISSNYQYSSILSSNGISMYFNRMNSFN